MRTIETMNAMIKTIIANNLTFLFIDTSIIIVKQATIPPWYNNLPMPPCKAVTSDAESGVCALHFRFTDSQQGGFTTYIQGGMGSRISSV